MNKRGVCVVGGLVLASAGAAFGQPYSENFDNVVGLVAGPDWAFVNNAQPPGLTNWFQGNLTVFPSHITAGYIGANYNGSTGSGNVSTWLFTPTRTLQNGDEFKFWARSIDSMFADRLSVRMSLNGSSTSVGSTTTSFGDFTTELLVINPGLTPGPGSPFPNVWTEHTIILSGIPVPTSGRIAFWYNVPGGGPQGLNADYIGIDTVSYDPASSICYPDCSGDGLLTVGDFGCFQGKYVLGDMYADCSGDGLLTVGDFGCFQGKYVLGCP